MEITHEDKIKILKERITKKVRVAPGGDQGNNLFFVDEIDPGRLAELLLPLLEK